MSLLSNIPPALLAMFGPPGAAGGPPANGVAPPPTGRIDRTTGKPAPSPDISMGPGGVNLAPPGPPGVGASGIPQVPMPRGAAFGPPSTPSSPPMKSSDDPGITGMPALPTPPDISKSPVVPVNNQYQSDLAKRAAFGPGPSPQDYKPSIGRRIGGGLLGAVSGGLASLAGEAPKDAVATGTATGSRVTNRAFNNAQGMYQRGTSALDKQLEAERGGFPIAEAAGKLPQEDFTNKMGVARETREQKVGQGRIDSSEARAEEQKTRADQLQNLIDHPKTTPPKNADEALAQAYLETDPEKRTTLMDAATALHKQEIERAQQGRPPKEPKAPKVNSVGIENERSRAWAKAKQQYNKDTEMAGNDPELRKQADANFKDAQQEAQDAYERAIEAGGGNADHVDFANKKGDGEKPGAAQPKAQPTTPANKPTPVKELKGHKVGETVSLKGKPVKITALYSDGSFDHTPAGGAK